MSVGWRERTMMGAVLCAAALAIGGAAPGIDATASHVSVVFQQESVPVEAAFKQVSGHVEYNPANPAATQGTIVVQTTSFDMGDADYNTEVRKKAWLDSATFPTATFRVTSVKAGAPGHFDATGTLTLKGREQTKTVSVTASKVGARMAYDGSLTISRKAFAIGDPQWNDVVDDAVALKFHIVE